MELSSELPSTSAELVDKLVRSGSLAIVIPSEHLPTFERHVRRQDRLEALFQSHRGVSPLWTYLYALYCNFRQFLVMLGNRELTGAVMVYQLANREIQRIDITELTGSQVRITFISRIG
jgi:hypothetical protein